MIEKYKLFYTPTCPKCPAVKKYVKGNLDIEGEMIDASKPEGLEEAQKYNVSKAPTVVFFDDENNVICKAHTTGEIDKCLSKSQD